MLSCLFHLLCRTLGWLKGNLESVIHAERFRLLVASGNDDLRLSLVDSLTPAGYSLEEARGEREAVDLASHRRFDLVLLGLDLSETSGIDACRKLRAHDPQLRIVMAVADDKPEYEQVALDAGADDCIAAPFRFREVVARLGAVLRRVPRKRGPKARILRAGDLKVDLGRRLLYKAGREVHLSPREFDLLVFLMSNPETAFTHVKLIRALWGGENGRGVDSLRPHVNGLRKKLENDPTNPEYILTEPWVGYRFHNPGRPHQL
jgi:two-component system KDP operon response regulator KdpE